ncbi:DUF3307 domain-containing protein [Yersinia enterocolitica]|nr:DUF3307 domain-containing protein [Yersinia enterocolitica]EKN4914282.1 DUF3307 domain-containing protein [Yersinia enterocolitica]EKN5099337.1 DUF3307 domain-containing protein [Yersinia enterocolitica]ELI8406683.1 DUF3307 domain-containing protein [Yersinia enterocolitica]
MYIYLPLLFMILSHVIFDFYLQKDTWVSDKENKGFRSGYLYLHSAFHAVSSAGVVAITYWYYFHNFGLNSFVPALLTLFFMFITHVLIDATKAWTNTFKLTKGAARYFIIDQISHVIVIAIIWLCFFYPNRWLIISSGIDIYLASGAVMLIGLLSINFPASILIQFLLGKVSHVNNSQEKDISTTVLSKVIVDVYDAALKEQVKLAGQHQSTAVNFDSESVRVASAKAIENINILINGVTESIKTDVITKASDTNNAGKWIGYLERTMVFVFVLFGEFSAIAGMLAAKSVFRFNDLKEEKDSNKTEYIMIGTFSSFSIALIISLLTKYALSFYSG